MPGLHITDHQMRLYMIYRQSKDVAVAAKAELREMLAEAVRNSQPEPDPLPPKAKEGSRPTCESPWRPMQLPITCRARPGIPQASGYFTTLNTVQKSYSINSRTALV